MQNSNLNIPHTDHNGDICTTCENAPDCGFITRRQAPVSQCELFTSAKSPAIRRHHQIPSAPITDDSSTLLGLCSNCNNLETCTLTKPDQPKLYCEEFHRLMPSSS